MTGTHEIHFGTGSHISMAAQQLVDAVVNDGAETAEGVFNDIKLQATAGSTIESIMADYHAQSEAQAAAWGASPEGQAAKAAPKAREQSSQAKADQLIFDLETLDFASDAAVLDWFDRFQEPSDHVGVKADKAKVIRTFIEHGWLAGVNCGDDYREDDRDNSARYLAGQALSCLQSIGAIHQVFGSFHERWKAKFIVSAAPPA